MLYFDLGNVGANRINQEHSGTYIKHRYIGVQNYHHKVIIVIASW